MTRLVDKVALITGGGTGIGRAIALAFALEGAKIAVLGRRIDKLKEVTEEVERTGGACFPIAGDISSAKDAARAVQAAARHYGGLNVLVNNAGALHVGTVEGTAEAEWDRLLSINLKGPYLMSREILPEFRKAGGGAIVNVGSLLGLVGMKNRAAYCASKGGVTLLTKAMALDHGHENIRVNCICPSLVETDLVKSLFDSGAEGERLRQERIATFPLGRAGRPPDVASMAVFLASEESSWVTGAAFPLDGGLSAY